MWLEASKTFPDLSTERLRLRSINLADVDAFFDIHSDAETLRYWSGAPISKRSEAESLVRKEMEWSVSGQAINWGIALPETNQLIGKFTLFQYSEQNRRAEVGYLLNRDYWGRGYMSEVMECALSYAFDVLNLRRLEADTDPENTASLALLEKFSFKREGYFRKRWLVCDKWLDSVMLGLLKEDYLDRS
jgi:ribosomal-protein-alanine N-acetyltransferase